ncbi:hypothetical protein D3C85_902080 [compost metagenome]
MASPFLVPIQILLNLSQNSDFTSLSGSIPPAVLIAETERVLGSKMETPLFTWPI